MEQPVLAYGRRAAAGFGGMCLRSMIRSRGFAETLPTGGKPLIVLIEYRSLAPVFCRV
jgi:hypothetical protein